MFIGTGIANMSHKFEKKKRIVCIEDHCFA